jgi:hypothetical protein
VARMGRREMRTKFWLEGLKGGDHSQNLGAEEENIKMYLRETGLEGVDWIHGAQDRDRWRAPVNTVMKLRVP